MCMYPTEFKYGDRVCVIGYPYELFDIIERIDTSVNETHYKVKFWVKYAGWQEAVISADRIASLHIRDNTIVQ